MHIHIYIHINLLSVETCADSGYFLEAFDKTKKNEALDQQIHGHIACEI
jgi:hypothetical protein